MAYESAIAYDAVHAARGKDYTAEAGQITALIRAAVPRAASLLDLACGSGGHLAHFQRDFADVVGLDASQVMLDAAAIRAPSAQLVLGDLADFDLSRRFDAIVCLFSSLGYLRDTGRLRSAAASIARHLNREGIVLVEPWLTAEQFGTGRISVDTGQSAHRTVARITRSSVVDGRAVLATDYLVAEADVTEHITERHEMTLFAHADYLEGMRTAGLDAQLDGDAGPAGRGLITARSAGLRRGLHTS